MKNIAVWCKIVSLLMVCSFSSYGDTAKNTVSSKKDVVVDANQFSISLASGQTFSTDLLIWSAKFPAWKKTLGSRINYNGSACQSNRYGDLQCKILSSEIGWLQKHWIEKGWAYLSGIVSNSDQMYSVLRKSENKARETRRGLWGKMKPFYENGLRKYRLPDHFQIVEGQVRNVVSIRGTTYLNFGNDWREDFTASVSSKNKKNFRKQDWKLSDLTNKWIRVRGRVRDYNGPYMDLIFPQQVELLGQPES